MLLSLGILNSRITIISLSFEKDVFLPRVGPWCSSLQQQVHQLHHAFLLFLLYFQYYYLYKCSHKIYLSIFCYTNTIIQYLIFFELLVSINTNYKWWIVWKLKFLCFLWYTMVVRFNSGVDETDLIHLGCSQDYDA